MGYGCAEYSGKNPGDAKRYLDKSQGRKGFNRKNPGHARNHCSNPDSKTPCVETYSKRNKKQIKSGFLSEIDQDLVGHYVLKHPRVQRELNILNQYNQANNNSEEYTRRSITLSVLELGLPIRIMVGDWFNGVLQSTSSMDSVTIVLQHFDGQETNPNAPVHILTFYPKISYEGGVLKVTVNEDSDDDEPGGCAVRLPGESEESESNEFDRENSIRGPSTIFTMRNLIIAGVACGSAVAMFYFMKSPQGKNFLNSTKSKFFSQDVKRKSDVNDVKQFEDTKSLHDNEPGAYAMGQPSDFEEKLKVTVSSQNNKPGDCAIDEIQLKEYKELKRGKIQLKEHKELNIEKVLKYAAVLSLLALGVSSK